MLGSPGASLGALFFAGDMQEAQRAIPGVRTMEVRGWCTLFGSLSRPQAKRVATWLLLSALGLSLFVARASFLDSQLWWSTSEQLDFGLFPHHLVRGLEADPADYLPEPQEGCALIWGAACAPVFAVVGSTRAALRWCNLLWHSAMGLVFMALALAAAGRWAAGLVFLLWLAAPPAIVDSSHFGWVTHVDAGLLTGLTLLALAGSLSCSPLDQARWPGTSSVLCLIASGAFAGLAFYFYFSTAMALAGIGLSYLLVVWRLQGPQLGPRLGLFGVGTTVGLSPFLWGGGYWEHEGGRATLLGLLTGLVGGTPSPTQVEASRSLVERAAGLLSSDLPGMFGFLSGPVESSDWSSSGAPIGLVYLGLLGLAGLAACFTSVRACRDAGGLRRDPVQHLVVLTALSVVVLHLAGCLASGFDLSQGRYLLPSWSWMVLLGGVGLAGCPRLMRWGGLGLLLVVGVGPRGALEDARRQAQALPEQLSFAEGLKAYEMTVHPLGRRLAACDAQTDWSRMSQRYPEDLPALARLEGWSIASCEEHDGAVGDELTRPGALYRSLLAEGIGEEVADRRLAGDIPGRIPEWLREDWALELGQARAEVRKGVSEWEGAGLPRALFEVADQTRRLRCIALGDFARVTAWTYEPLLSDVPGCPPEEFAAGFGVALARAMSPPSSRPRPRPRLAWWPALDVLPASVEDAFFCAYREESGRIERLGSEGADSGGHLQAPWAACLTELEAAELAPYPSPTLPSSLSP